MTVKIISYPLDHVDAVPEALVELEKSFADGFEVVAHAVYDIGATTFERWCLRKTVAPGQLGVRVIVSIEPDQTYSKSQNQYFDFWRCTLESGGKVNIFDHPDPARNTFKIAVDHGWQEFFTTMDQGIDYELTPPLPVVVSWDGEWYSLIDMMTHANYQDIVSPEPDTGPEAFPLDDDAWYTESPDDLQSTKDLRATIDNLRAGISFDEPPGLSECSMCGKERTLNSQGRCSQCQTVWDS